MIRTQGVRQVLLIRPSFFSASKRGKLIENIRRKFLSRKIRIFSTKCEQNFIILDMSDLAVARCNISCNIWDKKRLYGKQKIVALEAQQRLSRILLGLKVRSVSLVFIYHLLTVNLIKNGTISTKR